MNVSKSFEYKRLVETVKESYRNCDNDSEMGWCDIEDGEDLCREINLWTYWQGFGYAENAPHIKYLVVGQDFGPVRKEEQKGAIGNVRKLNDKGHCSLGNDVLMFHSGTDLNMQNAQTDKKLVELFDKVLKYKEIDKIPYSDLFFSNYCLGYRKEKYSGSIKDSTVNKDSKYMKMLIDILEPDNIITLGAVATKGVLRCLGVQYDKKLDFNGLIGGEFYYKDTRIFPEAHPGYWGVRNRGNEKVIEDWENIRSCAK